MASKKRRRNDDEERRRNKRNRQRRERYQDRKAEREREARREERQRRERNKRRRERREEKKKEEEKKKRRKRRRKTPKGWKHIATCSFWEIDGYMTDAMRRGYEMIWEGFGFGPRSYSPVDESDAMEYRRQMREDGDAHFGPGEKGDVRLSSDSWRIQDWIEVWDHIQLKQRKFKWVR